ncbi:bifunctional folylpolyglutamate synthase/dihydrofolate synthase [Halorhodospira halophila]|uniref:Dihydrofolate synthase/folylpolyglutamate synthase n=1 Tax=Halorhodospira halophila (strain DSM 244 / SL1) TaxID=349124 RepID=A1WY03_HALHL|nr:folylpolyglutamate synthase/dihydrofolate synthase family protein [Halorhodospira halophila]ABM62565.1 FolC bifunctional protein [Halorhodospira halophila SL1]MBK1728244.1 bifunctional folylpolyglutamate synthase/dihydrofolate synthase [Halorhodospira halophila]
MNGARRPQPAAPPDLEGWLARLEAAHPTAIDLGLERVAAVGLRLGVLAPAARVVTVGGTNGKGSVARTLEALLRGLGVSTALYTSPHFQRFNERMRLDGVEVADAPLVKALGRVEEARGDADVSLTYFEHTTLAAFDLFARSGARVWILEVGLGGRLDAVNAIDADVAVVTRIARDHAEFLGDDLQAIAAEKAGIFRKGRPAVIGQQDAPAALRQSALEVGAEVAQAGVEWTFSAEADGRWWWRCGEYHWGGLPASGIPGCAARGNVATALAALVQLPEAVGVDAAAVARLLDGVRVPGRLERIEAGSLEWLLDVAHNADGAEELARVLDDRTVTGQTRALFAVAARKDARALVAALSGRIDAWYLPQLDEPDMRNADELASQLADAGESVVHCGDGVATTLAALQGQAGPGDRVVVFGSFRTVAAVQAQQGWG